jgi:hypothetical protein
LEIETSSDCHRLWPGELALILAAHIGMTVPRRHHLTTPALAGSEPPCRVARLVWKTELTHYPISQLLALTKRLYFSETSSMTLSDSLQNEVHKSLERRVAIILPNEETPFSGESLGYQPFSHNRWLEDIGIC